MYRFILSNDFLFTGLLREVFVLNSHKKKSPFLKLKNLVAGKTNCKYCEGFLQNIMLNKRYKNFHSAKSLVSSNHVFNIFLDAHINSFFLHLFK